MFISMRGVSLDRPTNTRVTSREFIPVYVQYLLITWLGVAFLYWGIALATGYATDRFCLLLTTCLCAVAVIGAAATYKKGSLHSPIAWGITTSLLLMEIIFIIATYT